MSGIATVNAIGTEAGKGGDRRHLRRGGVRGVGRGIVTETGKGIVTVNATATATGTSGTDATGTTEETTAIATTATGAGTRLNGGDRPTAATIRLNGDGHRIADGTGDLVHPHLCLRTGRQTGVTLWTGIAIG